MRIMERNGLCVSKTCQVYMPRAIFHEKSFYGNYTCSKAGMLAFKQVYLSYTKLSYGLIYTSK